MDSDDIGDVCDPDRDGYGIAYAQDNCPDLSNAVQANADGDAQGNDCDADDE